MLGTTEEYNARVSWMRRYLRDGHGSGDLRTLAFRSFHAGVIAALGTKEEVVEFTEGNILYALWLLRRAEIRLTLALIALPIAAVVGAAVVAGCS